MQQFFRRWDNGIALAEPLDSVSMATFPDSSAVLLVLGMSGEGFLVRFHDAIAVSAHDEHAHWLMDDNDATLPQLAQGGAYPMLIVGNSRWAAGFSDVRRRFAPGPPTHYLILTLNNHVDVLSHHEPTIERAGAGEWERLFGVLVP